MLDDILGGLVALEALKHPATAAVLAIGIAAGVGHYAFDRVQYGDDYESLVEEFATNAAEVCGNDDNDRAQRIFARVHRDASSFRQNFAILPTKQVRDTLQAASEHNLVLYPPELVESFYTMGDGIQGVIYNEADQDPVFVYRDMDRAKLQDVMDLVEDQGGIQEGTLVVRWDSAARDYTISHLEPGVNEMTINNGTATVEIKNNPCNFSGGVSGVVKDRISDGIDDAVERGTNAVRDIFRRQP